MRNHFNPEGNITMSKSKIILTLVVLLVSAWTIQSFGQTVIPATQEGVTNLITVLKSQAPTKQKADACRLLAVIGTKDAVEPLAALLGDSQLSHMARYALEPIADPSVDVALRNALKRLRGLPLVGVIGSIGVRRDVEAAESLTLLLHDPDAQVAQAAARALGKIGNSEAATALQNALANAPAANQLDLCEGLFRTAEALTVAGQRDEAIAIYDNLLGLQAPHQVRGGALRGAILTRGDAGLSLMSLNLRSNDYILFSAALQAALEIPGLEATIALAAELRQLPAEKQVLVIQVLGKRADPAALPTLFDLAKNANESVSLAAIRVLPAFGDESAVPVLAELLASRNRQIAQAAQESLAVLPGEKSDAAVIELLNGSNANLRITAIELVERRRISTAMPALFETSNDPNPRVRAAAIKKIGELGGNTELPALLDLLMNLRTAQDHEMARQSIAKICSKSPNKQFCTANLMASLLKAQPAQKIVLLRVLSGIGGKDSLSAVREAIGDTNPGVHSAAIRALGSWQTADVAPELLSLATTAKNTNDRILCLQGYLRLAARPDLPEDQRLSMCRQAVVMSNRSNEKKLLLAALGSLGSLDAFLIIAPYLDDRSIREEAATAAIGIAAKLLQGENASTMAPKLIAPMEKITETADGRLAKQAEAMLRLAKSKVGGS